MTDTQSPKWHMRLDKNGALVSADAPLLQLHIDAGGSDNGILALPELLTMADHCQRLQMTLTRAVPVRRNTGNLRLWCRFEPDSKGVSITVEDWRELAADDAPKSQAKTADIKPTATTPDTKQEMPKSETPENIGTGEAVEAVESNDAAKNSDGKLRGARPHYRNRWLCPAGQRPADYRNGCPASALLPTRCQGLEGLLLAGLFLCSW